MWTFSQLPYERPDVAAMRADFLSALDRLERAASYGAAREVNLDINRMAQTLATAQTLADIRATLDMGDTFYEEEVAYFNRETARLAPLLKRWSEIMLASPHRQAFEAEYGKQLLVNAELERRTQSEAIVQDLIEERELCEEYKKTVAACGVDFRGERVNFYGLLRAMENPDRGVRREAYLAWAGLYEGVSGTLDELFDKLAAARARMAKALGLEGYTELAYLNMRRAYYTAREVETFRKQVREVVVPAVARLRQAQARRIGVDKLAFYDESFVFPDGNADPVGTGTELLAIARDMYHELSPETGAFIDFMVEHELFDLPTRPGKHLGGYCTYLADYGAPFIFANFNGSAADHGVLTHEAGHAFAVFEAAKVQPLAEFFYPTEEICEIHSMTMEHFTYPWMDRFFGQGNAKKAKFAHLSEALVSIPYLVSVDEFQHRVYAEPGMTATRRREVWKEIEGIYMPWRDYDGVPFLAEGGFWMQKQHIFLDPFYYIDYALAQMGAFELYGRMKTDRAGAWADYLRLCAAGGGLGYYELLKLANLSNPFEQGSVRRAAGHVIEELDGMGL